MELLIPFIVAAYFLLYTFALSIPLPLATFAEQVPLEISNSQADNSRNSLESWLQREEKIALDNLLANIAPGGRNVPDAAPGSVIASPSKAHPNYYFQWIRDAAITQSTLVDLYTAENTPSSLRNTISKVFDAYVDISHRLQHTRNPSGSFEDKLSGLGEPKFHADGSAYYESWGRPQRDGPALRAITLMKYLRAVNETNPSLWTTTEGNTWFKSMYDASLPADSVIKADLEYISHHWWESGFDLWEEIQGLHFFTAAVQLRALQEGADLARAFGDAGAARWYGEQAEELENFMPKFWHSQRNHLVETLNKEDRSGLDCGILLGALHGTTQEQRSPYPPQSDGVLLTLLGLVRDQRHRFPINSSPERPSAEATDPLSGVGIGRYPEDAYNGYESVAAGGNPWFLCTSSVAEVLYRTAEHLISKSTLHVSERGLPFYQALLSMAPAGVRDDLQPNQKYTPNDEVFNATISRLMSVGDAFLEVVKRHADAQGSLSEQFDRVTGFERGARDLTWSYGAFLEALWTRKRVDW